MGIVAGYDASVDRWMTLYRHPYAAGSGPPRSLTRTGHDIVYDPINERLVVYGGSQKDDVWAFDVATREWTRLLAPSGPSA